MALPAVRVPIVGGPLRGAWWDPRSGGKLLRVVLGTYETEQASLFARSISPGDIVFDLGAHVGYYTLIAARRVGAGGRVVAFEPDPSNVAFLRSHVAVNAPDRVEVVEEAVAGEEGEASFVRGPGSGTGRLGEGGEVTVRATTLDGFVERRGIAPDVVKIDVEGAEAAVLRGGAATLAGARPTIFLSIHGPGIREECLDLLGRRGYRCRPIGDELPERAEELLCLPPAEARG